MTTRITTNEALRLFDQRIAEAKATTRALQTTFTHQLPAPVQFSIEEAERVREHLAQLSNTVARVAPGLA
jgi:hypothetical protein